MTDSGEIALKKAMRRHTPPAVIIVDAKKMAEDGYAFYHPKANIWLTYEVPKEYILEAKDWIYNPKRGLRFFASPSLLSVQVRIPHQGFIHVMRRSFPSWIAHTTRDCPLCISPAVKTLGTLV